MSDTLPERAIGRLRSWSDRHRMAVDVGWLLFWSPLTLLATYAFEIEQHPGTGWFDSGPLLGTVLAVLYTAPLAWRSTRADAAIVAVAAGHVVQLVCSALPSPGNVTAPLMLYASARWGDRRLTRWWLALAAAGSVAAGLRWGFLPPVSPYATGSPTTVRVARTVAYTLVCLATVVAAWALGQWGHQREATVQSLRDRADALEREHANGLRLVVEEERTRLAREMHDVVAHSLSVIVVQSDGAAYLAAHGELGDADARLAQVERAVATINATARGALAETRRMVGVLRTEGEGAQLAPAATLAQVEGLVCQLRDAGLAARLTVTGQESCHPPLGGGAEMAAYRVVQESLTNVLKHGGPGVSVDVVLAHTPAGVDVSVRDDGTGGTTPSDGLGHGLVGMRERVSAWGGTMTAGPRVGGGWEVVAHLPAPTKETS